VKWVGVPIVFGEGDLVSGIPHLRGIEPPAFPIPLPRGPLQQQGKKLKERRAGTLCFFVPRHPLCKQTCNGLPWYKKKALKRCLRAFFCCCGERGILTYISPYFMVLFK